MSLLSPQGWAFRPALKKEGSSRQRNRDMRSVHFFEQKGQYYRRANTLITHCGKYRGEPDQVGALAELPEGVKGNAFKRGTRELVYPACAKCYRLALDKYKGEAARAPSPLAPGRNLPAIAFPLTRSTKGIQDPPSPLTPLTGQVLRPGSRGPGSKARPKTSAKARRAGRKGSASTRKPAPRRRSQKGRRA